MSNQVFSHPGAAQVHFKLKGNEVLSEASIYFDQDVSDQFDWGFDSPVIVSDNYIFTKSSDSIMLTQNGMSLLRNSVIIPVYIYVKDTTRFEVEIFESGFNFNKAVFFETPDDYREIHSYGSTSVKRISDTIIICYLHIILPPKTTVLSNVDCNQKGSVKLSSLFQDAYPYKLYSLQGLVKMDTLNEETIIDNLEEGYYFITSTISDFLISEFLIIRMYPDSIHITLDSNSNTVVNNSIMFASNLSPATPVKWEFDDGFISYNANPSHTYHNAGIYNVKLSCLDHQCVAPVYYELRVETAMNTKNPDINIKINLANHILGVSSEETLEKINVIDLQGRILYEMDKVNSKELELNIKETNAFIINITTFNGYTYQKKIIQ